nr:molecular chaperone DnaJ [Rhodospirillales bacterium]
MHLPFNFIRPSLVSQRKSHHIKVMVDNIEKNFTLASANNTETNFRSCDWPSCRLEGIHRAPKSQERIQEYDWFCLEHVRIYNNSWNYYESMSDEEVDELIRSDTTWNRPTWPSGDRQRGALPNTDELSFGTNNIGTSYGNFSDPFGFFTKDRTFKRPTKQNSMNCLSVRDKKALSLLGFDVLVKTSELKARYKLLVKKYHPDSTGGNKKLEERFKQINEAYEIVMTRLTNN